MNKFDIRQVINGDSVIGFTSAKEMKTQGWMDASKVSAYLQNGEGAAHKKHLGMINLFNTTHNVAVPFMKDLFESSSVLSCEEGESILYDLPVVRSASRTYTAEDTSNKNEAPGVDESYFELVLNTEFTKGDILTYDPQFGEQVIVSSEHEIERRGENFVHLVQYSTNNRNAAFPKQWLVAGINYMKIGNVLAEYDTTFSSISMIKGPAGTITSEFILGSPRGVETFITSKAARMQVPGLNAVADDTREQAMKELSALGGKDREMFFVAKLNKDGKGFKAGNMKIGATLEYLALMEMYKMETYSLLFAKAATLQSSNGVKRVNEGVWHQIRRGKIIKYARPGAITLDHFYEAAEYIYKNSAIEPKDRIMEFKGGWYAYQNALQILSSQALLQLAAMPTGMFGTDMQTKDKLFSGSLDDLQMQAVQIRSVLFPGIGRVRVTHDPTMDYQPLSDRNASGMYGEGKAHTSYSLTISDVSKPEYTNVADKVRGASLVEGGARNSNIYYISPEGGNLVYGYEQGRMENGSQTTDIVSSLKYMGRTFWAKSTSAALVLDTTRYLTIELVILPAA